VKSRRIFVSFANSELNRSLVRISKEAEATAVYDRILALDENNLDADFRRDFAQKLSPKVRGFGYWVWKPQVILQTLAQMEEGDLLNYADVGFHINPHGVSRLEDYFHIAAQSESGVLGFQGRRPEPPMVDDGRELPTWPDGTWAKGDLLDRLGVRGNTEITSTPTIQAGLMFIRKCANSERFIKEWLEIFYEDFAYVDDSPSVSANLKEFRSHRHDQSVFSMLGKLNKIETVSSNEFWYPRPWNSSGDWEALHNFPFHAKRDLDYGPVGNLSRKVKQLADMLTPKNLANSARLFVKRVRLYRELRLKSRAEQ
jgi:hypothetical protein